MIDAIPGWQYVGNEEFQNNSIRDVRQMVRRDRNHPSIVLWEASLNESGMTRQFMERAHQAVHEKLPVADVKTERKTPLTPAKIILSVDLSGKELQAGKNELIFVYASVTDSEGTVIPDDKRAVSFMVEGDAECIGDNPRNAEAGISTILLKAGEKPGIIRIKASAEGLAAGEIIISSKLFSESTSLHKDSYFIGVSGLSGK